MRFFDAGQSAYGFIAIGQEAVGVIAIGQLALGVVAIGQMARGVFVVGQLAIGVFSIGQLAIGLWFAAGMVGVAGRTGKGLVFELFPKAKKPKELPELTELSKIENHEVSSGWIEVRLDKSSIGVGFEHAGKRIELEPTGNVAREIAVERPWPIVRLQVGAEERHVDDQKQGYRDPLPTEEVLIAHGFHPVPPPPRHQPGYVVKLALRTVGMSGLLALYYVTVVAELWNAFAPKTLFLPTFPLL